MAYGKVILVLVVPCNPELQCLAYSRHRSIDDNIPDMESIRKLLFGIRV